MDLIISLALGMMIGWKIRGWYHPPAKKPWEKRKKRFDASVIGVWFSESPVHEYGFRELDLERLTAIASRFLKGRKVTFRTMAGKHKLFSE